MKTHLKSLCIGTRWRQFRLSTLLLATLAVALLFPLFVFPAQSQRRSRQWVLSQKGSVVLDPKYHIEGAWYVSKNKSIWPLPKLMVDALGIDMFVSAKIVVLDCDEIYDLSSIVGLRNLEELHINQFVHESVDFKVLQEMRHLKKLSLSEWAGLTKDDVAAIEKLLPGVEVVAEE